MSAGALTPDRFYGLVELDAEGMVLFSRWEAEDGVSTPSPADVTGRNFFTEVAPFTNVEEFRRQLDSFSSGAQQAESQTFTCQYDDGPVPVRVLLARIRERAERSVTRSVLVHIRKV